VRRRRRLPPRRRATPSACRRQDPPPPRPHVARAPPVVAGVAAGHTRSLRSLRESAQHLRRAVLEAQGSRGALRPSFTTYTAGCGVGPARREAPCPSSTTSTARSGAGLGFSAGPLLLSPGAAPPAPSSLGREGVRAHHRCHRDDDD
jgi:hypothetical protein